MAGEDKATIDKKVDDAARVLNLTNYLDRRPGQLSGGQRQRVAIGRAIVRQPSAFLFDEPLSNLDAALRGTMRLEISELHHQLKTTMIYVTHDQVEAMTMADKIVVLNAGNIEQVGSPLELYKQPEEPVRRRLHRLAEDEPDRGRAGSQVRRQDDRHPPRASERLEDQRATGRPRSASPSISAPTPSCMSSPTGRPADGARRWRNRRRPWRHDLPDAGPGEAASLRRRRKGDATDECGSPANPR